MARLSGAIPPSGAWFSFADRGVPPMLVCSLAQLGDALSLTTTVAKMRADVRSGRNGWLRGRVDVLDSEGKLHSWRPWVPRYSVPRLVRTRCAKAPFSAWKGKTRPFQRMVAMIGVLQS
jgi:hypothetical protein